MTDKTQPEAGSTHIIRYALELGLLWIDGDGRDKVREALDALDALEAKLTSIRAGGVQALSAAPAVPVGWKLVPVEPTADQEWAGKNAALRCSTMGEACKIYKAMLAASPPAEQTFITPETGNSVSAQGAAITSESGAVYAPMPRAAYIEFDGREETAWHTPDQMRDFADRTHALRMQQDQSAGPCAICGSDEPFTGTCGSGDPRALCQQAAPKAAPKSFLDGADVQDESGVLAYYSREAVLACINAALESVAAPKAAPGDVLDEALRERDDAEDFIDALLDEVLGHERPEWSSSYGRADALNDVQERMTALHKPAVDKAWGRFQSAMAAPQQEAQEPVAWQGVHDQTDLYYTKPTQADVRPLYAAPQPAPAPLSDEVVKDAARWRMAVLIGSEVMLHPNKRTHATAVKAYMDATHSGSDLTGAVDAAIAAQADSVPAVEREQERIAFKDAHRHLDLDEVPDAWGRPMFKHSHVEASWLGWIARASRGKAPAVESVPVLPDFDTVEQHIYGACRRYITQDMLEPIHNLIRDAIDADRTARASAESAERDAERYRWLREGNDAKHGAAWHVAVNLYGCEWDAAIDAALAAQGGKV